MKFAFVLSWLILAGVGASAQLAFVDFTQTTFHAAEDAGAGTVTFLRWGDTNSALTVDWHARSGTAIAGLDFVGVTNTLAFAPGETNKTALVPLIDDGWVEEAESILLGFGAFSTGASTGLVNTATLIIDDNEIPTLLDGAFDSGAGTDDDVFALAVQDDGRILVGGQFGICRSGGAAYARPRIARFNADGSIDSSFNVGAGPDGDVYAIAVQADGKVLIGGSFTAVNGVSQRRVARLNSNGALDASFTGNATDELRAVVVQPDGKILIAGRFTTVHGQSRNRVARLETNGAPDVGFNPGTGADNNVRTLVRQDDGRLLIGGQFTTYNGTNRARIARLEASGALDLSFNPGTGVDDQVRAIAVQSDASILIGGAFNTVNGLPRPALARLLPDGTLDGAFNPQLGSADTVRAIAVQTNGSVLVGGLFDRAGGAPRRNLARLRTRGTTDPSLLTVSGPDNEVFALALQPDGQVVIGGQFLAVGDMPRSHLARVMGDSGTPTVEYAAPTYGAAEVWGQATIGVRRTGHATDTVSATFFTADGTAMAGSDYTATSIGLSFAPLQITNAFTVPIASDGLTEADETVWLGISNPAGALAGANRNASLVIADHEGFGSLAVYPPLLSETSLSAGALVVRSGGTNLPLALEYATSDGSAIAGQDYVAAAGVFTLAPGVTSGYIDLNALNDTLREPTENFSLSLWDAQTGVLVTNVTVTIADNELGIGFDGSDVTIDEAAQAVTLYVVCRSDLAGPVEVDYATRDFAAAQAGLDYLPQAGTLTFSASGDVRIITVPLVNDGLTEEPESFQVQLTALRGPSFLSVTNRIVTIGDNDGPLEFVATNFFVGEGGGLAALALRRRDDGTNTVTVDFAAANGSALAGSDFTATTGTLELPPGPDARWITIPILNDLAVESDETFQVVLSNPTGGASLGSVTSATVRILDDDRPGGLDLSFGVRPDEAFGWYHANLSLARQSDGKVLVGGWGLLARLQPDGALDTNFDAGPLYYGEFVPAVQRDGLILVGTVSSNDLVVYRPAARLLTNGVLDPSFQAGVDFGRTRALAVQPNGRILIAGNYDGGWWDPGPATNNGILRLLPNGDLDTNFNAGTLEPRGYYYELPTTVETLLLQPDGRIVVGGKFTSVAGLACEGIMRLHTNGAPDLDFFRNPGGAGSNASPRVYTLAGQPNGQILAGGAFTSLQGAQGNAITRLNADGTPDPSFHSPFGPEVVVRVIRVEASGRIYVGGGAYRGMEYNAPNFVARLHPDGSIDETFDPGLPPDGPVTDLLVLPDSDVLVAGEFNTFNGIAAPLVVRLKGEASPMRFGPPEVTLLGVTLRLENVWPGQRVALLGSSNSTDWQWLATNRPASTSTSFFDAGPPTAAQRFYRARQMGP